LSSKEKKEEIEKDSILSIREQAALLQLNRSSLYYDPMPLGKDLSLMALIDQIYTNNPWYGRRRVHAQLLRDGYTIGERHVGTLMEKMGYEAICPKPNTSKKSHAHLIYPYLLRGVHASYPNHIWATDITYIKMKQGFIYLCVMLDWFSRYIISWHIEERIDVVLPLQVLTNALRTATPLIHNSDQGSVFTANAYTQMLVNARVQISMDGKARCFDNIFTERLWRTIKYEEVYLKDYLNPREAKRSLGEYILYYNTKRLHSALSYHTPEEYYFNR